MISGSQASAYIQSSLGHAPYPDVTNCRIQNGPVLQGIRTISEEKGTDAFGQATVRLIAEGPTGGTSKARIVVDATITDPANNTGIGEFTVSVVGGAQVWHSGPMQFGQVYA